ncbi:LegC family aminotransferase [Lederbergia wuyishanensis]|uniref:Perosamine synthetase n=1 Tax=Lederbergia wuyishanensis TaxID=1347903 RepID=A0ABU0D8S8_9BACI|nr:LegC family aminotransferase [Lederbergia wuyishanensis]MCJ8007604.1 LegC family aminotransferase [Lederbergia wuyishanensis]MDQ0344812.1 perosamine synthetase [Lederbergia wuyishanensis]
MNTQWTQIVQEIKEIYNNKDVVPLHEPTFGETEIEYVTDCIRTGWVSSVGKYVDDFEEKLAEYTGVKRAVAVVNGTAALHIALKVAGVQTNDEVFMPALTFVATANAATYLQAIPHFVDVSEETLGLDPVKLEDYIQEIGEMRNGQLVNKKTSRIIRAVVPMHTFGHPVDLDPLIELCGKYNLMLVEDAAESLGSFYKGKHTGCFGIAGALSFNGNKIMTTGGGGAILTNDEKLADYAKHITTTAKVPHRWEYVHDEIGFNYRMPNINAALGCAQLEKLDSFLASKRQLTNSYMKLFEQVEGMNVYNEPIFAKSNYWLQTLIIASPKYKRDEILETLNSEGILARPMWKPLDELSPYAYCPKGDLTTTNKIDNMIINLPSTPPIGG